MNSNIDSKFKKLAICLSIFAVLVIGRILFLQTNASAVELKETIGKAYEYTTLSVSSERGNIYDRKVIC